MDENLMTATPRVLSVQSHVVHGYAGNRAAVFPLQLLGFEVDFINSCQYSNHTGYPFMAGSRVSAEDLGELYKGLQKNKVSNYSHILTGYVAEVEFLRKLGEIIRDIKQRNKKVIYLCDPVLGDNGEYYVPPSLKSEFLTHLIPLCDIVTPNQFELGELTGIDVSTERGALKAIDKLHDVGAPAVILTSATFGDDRDKIICIGSTRQEGTTRFKIEVPRLNVSLVGTGDLFACTTLAWNTRLKSIQDAVVRAVNTVYAVIRDTMLFSETLKFDPEIPEAARKELRLIENRHLIVDPPTKFFFELI